MRRSVLLRGIAAHEGAVDYVDKPGIIIENQPARAPANKVQRVALDVGYDYLGGGAKVVRSSDSIT
jgi:hypothetical protein